MPFARTRTSVRGRTIRTFLPKTYWPQVLERNRRPDPAHGITGNRHELAPRLSRPFPRSHLNQMRKTLRWAERGDAGRVASGRGRERGWDARRWRQRDRPPLSRPPREIAACDGRGDCVLADVEILLRDRHVGVIERRFEHHQIVTGIFVDGPREGLPERVRPQPAVVFDAGGGKRGFDDRVRLHAGDGANSFRVLPTGKKRERRNEIKRTFEPTYLTIESTLEFGQHRHVARRAVAALQVSRLNSDPRKKSSISPDGADGRESTSLTRKPVNHCVVTRARLRGSRRRTMRRRRRSSK